MCNAFLYFLRKTKKKKPTFLVNPESSKADFKFSHAFFAVVAFLTCEKFDSSTDNMIRDFAFICFCVSVAIAASNIESRKPSGCKYTSLANFQSL